MIHHRRRRQASGRLARVFTVATTLLVLTVTFAAAQAPVSGMHTSMGPGAGLVSDVSPAGGYSTAVPLDLPSPRGPVPVPVSLVHVGGSRAGVAGVAWDVPLSSIRVSSTAWHRKPLRSGSDPQAAAERVVLTLDGASTLMVPRDDHYVPFAGGQYQELRHVGSAWKLTTLDNLEYTFSPIGTNLWWLTEIRERAGRDRVVLAYASEGVAGTSCQAEPHLASVSYTFDATGQTPLYQILLDYAPNWRPAVGRVSGGNTVACGDHTVGGVHESVYAFEHVQEEGLGFDRKLRLAAIRVVARDNLIPSATPHEVRAYHLDYTFDLATDRPLLTTVTMTGEQGTPAAATPFPVATYGYGPTAEPATATKPTRVELSTAVDVPGFLNAGSTGHGLSTSETTTNTLWGFLQPNGLYQDAGPAAVRSRTKITRLLRDFTGDGLPDLLYRQDGTWRLYANRLGPSGPDFSTLTTQWSSASGPADVQMTTTLRFIADPQRLYPYQRDAMTTTETWTQFADWDGDGRIDVLEADGGYDRDHWRVWLNRPDQANGLIWRDIQVDISSVRSWLEGRGHVQMADANLGLFGSGAWSINLPLERSRSSPYFVGAASTRHECGFTGCTATWQPPEGNYGKTIYTETITEWQLTDRNSDGFLDFAAITQPARRCSFETPSGHPHCPDPRAAGYTGDYDCGMIVEEYPLSVNSCDPAERDPQHPSHAAYFLNRTGPFTAAPAPYGGQPIDVEDQVTLKGLARWVSGNDDTPQVEAAAAYYYSKPPQDGLTWQAAELNDQRQTGTLYLDSAPNLASRAGAARFDSNRKVQCEPFPLSYSTIQTGGTADLDGDGRADLLTPDVGPDWVPTVAQPRPVRWRVRFATGAGFGPELTLESSDFALSESGGECDDALVETTAGLTDLDGDGRPELLRVTPGGVLTMRKLTTADGPLGLAAGRLRTIDNGHGATTIVEYANRKVTGPHNGPVPVPEIVVTSIRTDISDGSAPGSAPTYYGYGEPSMGYDALAGRWGFQGYRRQVTVAGTPSAAHDGALDGVITFVDRHAAAVPGASFAEHAQAHQLERTEQVERSHIMPNTIPALVAGIGVMIPFASSTTTYAVETLSPSQVTAGAAALECGDLKPDTGEAVGTALCGTAGLIYPKATESWEGTAPPATSNVMVGSVIEAVDVFGRPTATHDRGDLRRDDDDVCTHIYYAATASGRPFPSVPARVIVDDCGMDRPWESPATATTVLAATGFRYDGMAEGVVGDGFLTSRTVDRYGPTGYLDTIDAEQLQYSALGQVSFARFNRLLGTSATREISTTYDTFGASVTIKAVSSSDTLSQWSYAQTSTWPSKPIVVTDPTGVTTTTLRDGFGRSTHQRVTDADGTATTLQRVAYHDESTPRTVDVDTFPVGAAPGSEDIAPDRQRVVTVLDAFNRPRYHWRPLGGDYGGAALVEGLVAYDELGRVAYAAQPFSTSLDALAVASTFFQLPYGSTTVYDRRGRISRVVDATGRDEESTTSSAAANRFVRSAFYSYAAGQAATQATDAEGNDPTSDHAGVHSTTWTTATGREVETAHQTMGGQILDRIAFEQDRLGHLIRTRRFGALGTPPVIWQASYDSLGRRLTLTEPGMAIQTTSYDEEGQPLETSWQDGAIRRVVRHRYDGLSRLTERVLAHAPTAGGELVESTDHYLYDAHYIWSPPSQGSALGHLVAVLTDGVGGVYYAHDSLGRTSGTAYIYDGQTPVQERTTYTPGGETTDLFLEAGATSDHVRYEFDSAARVRRVRDGAGPTVYFDATGVSPIGQYWGVAYGNGVTEDFVFDEQGRRQLHEWDAMTASGSTRFINWFDVAGRLQHERQEMPTSSAELDYHYDSLGRLTQSLQVGGANEGLEWFGHDPLGNLAVRMAGTPAGTREYTTDVADPDRLCRYQAFGDSGPCQFTYDAAGNVTDDTSGGDGLMERRTFSYDSGQQLRTIHRGATTADLIYGPLGHIATLVTGTAPRQTWTFGSLIERRIRSDSSVQIERRIPGPLGVVATLKHHGTDDLIIYTHGDDRGNRFFTDDTGHVVQETTYGPFGRVTSDNGDPASPSYTDDLWNGGDDLRELGVVLLGPRAYDPAIGRFLQRDPIIHDGSGSTGNPYSFAFGDPVNLSDPTGLSPWGLNIFAWTNGQGQWATSHMEYLPALALGLVFTTILDGDGPGMPQAPVAVPMDAYDLAHFSVMRYATGEAGRTSTWTKVGRVARKGAAYAVKYGAPALLALACTGPQGLACLAGAGLAGGAIGSIGSDIVMGEDSSAGSVTEDALAGAGGNAVGGILTNVAERVAFRLAARNASKPANLALRYSQTTASPSFSSDGFFPEETIGELAGKLRAGSVLPSDVPVRYVTLDGNNLIVNTRSSLALTRANVPQSGWTLIDTTATDTAMIRDRLLRNGLGSDGATTIRITGRGKAASSLD